MNNEVVSFIGVIGSGKGYQQRLLMDKGYVALDFKDELLDMVEDLMGFPISMHPNRRSPEWEKDYERFKECVIGTHFLNDTEKLTTQKIMTMVSEPKLLMTGRRLLQRLGTEAIRKRTPNYWADAWKKKAEEILGRGNSIACADCRFINEVRATESFANPPNPYRIVANIKFIFCDYRSNRYDANSTHVSEKLAQALLRSGFKDGQEIPESWFNEHIGELP